MYAHMPARMPTDMSTHISTSWTDRSSRTAASFASPVKSIHMSTHKLMHKSMYVYTHVYTRGSLHTSTHISPVCVTCQICNDLLLLPLTVPQPFDRTFDLWEPEYLLLLRQQRIQHVLPFGLSVGLVGKRWPYHTIRPTFKPTDLNENRRRLRLFWFTSRLCGRHIGQLCDAPQLHPQLGATLGDYLAQTIADLRLARQRRNLGLGLTASKD